MTAGDAIDRSLVAGLRCADLVDAMGRSHKHRCHILDIVTPTPERVLFGPAVTISYFPTCSAEMTPESFNFAALLDEAAGGEPKGKVLVAATNGYSDTSVAGGTKLTRIEALGMAGVITDGRLRDFDEIRTSDFVAYCSGEGTHWGGGTITPFLANVPVVIGGVGVMPGHYVYADSSGAVVLPRSELRSLLAEARRIQDEDATARDRILSQGPHFASG